VKKTLAFSFIAAAAFITLPASAAEPISFNGGDLTFYGRLVAGVDYTTSLMDAGVQGHRTQVASNQWGTSFLGLRYELPLRDGITAVGNLESGFGSKDGTSNDGDSLFDRQANVGVKTPYGQVTIGNHMWITNDSYAVDPMEHQWIGLNSVTNGRYWRNGNNTIAYRSPQWNGLQLGLMRMAGGTTGSDKRSSGNGAAVSYRGHGLDLLVVADTVADRYGRYTGGANYGLGSQGSWNFAKGLLVGGAYEVGAFKLFAGYSETKAKDATYGTFAAFDNKAKVTYAGLHYQATSNLKLLSSAYRLTQPVSGKKATLFALGMNYDWNKYLTTYATVGQIDNNSISDEAVSVNGASNHALYYWDTACRKDGNCNGVNSAGAYAGFVLKF